MALIDKLTAIAEAIRVKTGKADPLTLEQMATEIEALRPPIYLYIAKEVKAGTAEKYYPNTAQNRITTCRVSGSNDWQNRAFVQHDFSDIPAGSEIISAKLYVYAHGGNDSYYTGGFKFDVVTAEWEESSLTWNNQPTLANTPIPASWLVPTMDAWNNWDITEFVQRWVSQEIPNNGIMFVNKDENIYRANWDFYTRKYSTGEYSTYIEVEYSPTA